MSTDINICRICEKPIENDRHFWKFHRINIQDYHIKFWRKKDLLTNELLPFTSKESYFFNDFVNRTNLKKYLNTLSPEDQRAYCKDLLLKRKQLKKLVWTPTQVELRSLIMPSIITYNKLFDNYYNLCEELGFKNKQRAWLVESSPLPILRQAFTNDPNVHIIIDTREQRPLHFGLPVQVNKLDFGDYYLHNPARPQPIYVERKHLNDFISTLSTGYSRFINEIERARYTKNALIIVVECNLTTALNFNYSKWIRKFIKATPDFIFHRVRELSQLYPHIQFVFCHDRQHTANVIEFILLTGIYVMKWDLQLAIDQKIL